MQISAHAFRSNLLLGVILQNAVCFCACAVVGPEYVHFSFILLSSSLLLHLYAGPCLESVGHRNCILASTYIAACLRVGVMHRITVRAPQAIFSCSNRMIRCLHPFFFAGVNLLPGSHMQHV